MCVTLRLAMRLLVLCSDSRIKVLISYCPTSGIVEMLNKIYSYLCCCVGFIYEVPPFHGSECCKANFPSRVYQPSFTFSLPYFIPHPLRPCASLHLPQPFLILHHHQNHLGYYYLK